MKNFECNRQFFCGLRHIALEFTKCAFAHRSFAIDSTADFCGTASLPLSKHHVANFFPVPDAFFRMQLQIVRQNILILGKSQ
jgi:hypothetical protein